MYHEPTPDLNELAERYAKRAHILILDRIAARNNQTLRRQAALSGLKEYKLSVVDTKTPFSAKLKLGILMPTKPLISIRLSVVVFAAAVDVLFVADLGVVVVAGTSFLSKLKLGIFMFTKPLILTEFFISSFSMMRSGGSLIPGGDIMIQYNISVDLKRHAK